jgi:hypothetical protein
MHSAEIDVDLKRSDRDREAIMADIRDKLAVLPAQVAIGQRSAADQADATPPARVRRKQMENSTMTFHKSLTAAVLDAINTTTVRFTVR